MKKLDIKYKLFGVAVGLICIGTSLMSKNIKEYPSSKKVNNAQIDKVVVVPHGEFKGFEEDYIESVNPNKYVIDIDNLTRFYSADLEDRTIVKIVKFDTRGYVQVVIQDTELSGEEGYFKLKGFTKIDAEYLTKLYEGKMMYAQSTSIHTSDGKGFGEKIIESGIILYDMSIVQDDDPSVHMRYNVNFDLVKRGKSVEYDCASKQAVRFLRIADKNVCK